MKTGVFVLGMHRSGTSAATRLVSFLGLETPRGEDLVPPSSKNPKGYWESMSLVAFNTRVLAAVGSHLSCPTAFEPGWEDDPRLNRLRREAPQAFAAAFPTAPWVWKDPRNCLTLAFWRAALDMQPVAVLVNRNPIEIVTSSARSGRPVGKVYALALWERYLRQALRDLHGEPVLVTDYLELLSAPLEWCGRLHAFLTEAGIPAVAHREDDVLDFVDPQLRRAAFTRAEFLEDPDVSAAQRELYELLERANGIHPAFASPPLPPETPTTEALLAERRGALRARQELARLMEFEQSRPWSRLRRSRFLAPARPFYARLRRRAGGATFDTP